MKHRMAVLLALVVVLAAPSAARADPPVIERIPQGIPDSTTNVCGFPVLQHFLGSSIRRTFFEEQGNPVREITTAVGFGVILTNGDTGKQIHVALGGPLFTEYHSDGSITFNAKGPWPFDQNPLTGEPGFVLVTGRWTFTVDADGTETFRFLTGHAVDLCARLA